jgi:hypothetical protein
LKQQNVSIRSHTILLSKNSKLALTRLGDPHLSPNMKNKMAIGVTLRSLGFQSTHTRSGNAYFAVFKKEKAA